MGQNAHYLYIYVNIVEKLSMKANVGRYPKNLHAKNPYIHKLQKLPYTG